MIKIISSDASFDRFILTVFFFFFSRGIGRWRGLPIIPESSYDLEKKGREHRTGGDISQLTGMCKRIFKTRNKMASQKCKPHNHTYIAIMKELNKDRSGNLSSNWRKKSRNFLCHEADLGSTVDLFSFSAC